MFLVLSLTHALRACCDALQCRHIEQECQGGVAKCVGGWLCRAVGMCALDAVRWLWDDSGCSGMAGDGCVSRTSFTPNGSVPVCLNVPHCRILSGAVGVGTLDAVSCFTCVGVVKPGLQQHGLHFASA